MRFASFNPKKTALKIRKFIQGEVKKAGFSKVIIGLSGGIDSAVSAALAVSALSKENIFIGLFPYHDLNQEGLIDAQLVIKHLNLPPKNIFLINIGKICDEIFITDNRINNLRKGNIMARVRMTLLFDLAKKHKALVIGTENKSEHFLGYFTRFGDEASDLEPIRSLYKTEIRILAKYLQIPQKLIDKAPTAGLWPGQTDEGQFGFTYNEADQILYLLFEKKLTLEKIVDKGYSPEAVKKIYTWVKNNEFKHHLPKICD